MRTFLTLEEAWRETLDFVRVLEVEEVPLFDAYGRVLASPVLSAAPIPPFDRSALDGYAVRAEDITTAAPAAPVLLDVIEEVGAGSVPQQVVGAGQATRIMTGAPIPVGADSVVRLEATEREAANPRLVRILVNVSSGEAISRKGEDAPQGARLLETGCLIGAAETAVLATNGARHVAVYRRPRVGILVSGEEVRPLEEALSPGQIYDSNGPMLAALVRDLGAEPVLYGQVGDDMGATVRLVQQMVTECDLVLTTGGVSVGDYDLMREAYVQAGGEVLFWKVAMRPGTPVTFAQVAQVPVFGLSGNPAAAFVNFVMLVQPVIRKMAGYLHPEHQPVQAILDNPVEQRVIGLDRMLRAQLQSREGILTANVPSKGQKAGILTSLVGTQGLVRIPARTEAQQGAPVEVYVLKPGAL